MTERSFLDTNVLLYADDASSGDKQEAAISLIEAGFRSRKGVISTQVLQEYFVNATRKLGVTADVARASVELYQSMHTVSILPADILEAIDLHRLHSISLWDSLIVCAAAKSGCRILYSEDLQNGRRFGSVRVVNPF
jgi:predicted nucleic acid-binding protein